MEFQGYLCYTQDMKNDLARFEKKVKRKVKQREKKKKPKMKVSGKSVFRLKEMMKKRGG